MSHTLHRLGKRGGLASDWVVLAMSARGVNRRGSAALLRRFLRMAMSYGPVNFGDMKTGNVLTRGPRAILSRIRDDSLLNVVFDSEGSLLPFLEELREADLGLSVVVSGLLERGCRCAAKAGLVPHTLALSLGVWGRTERLPDERTLEITTMCGHGLVSPRFARLMAGKVAAGEMTASRAARELARPCVCGAFNPVKAEKVLGKMAGGRAKAGRPRASGGDGGSSRSRSKRAAAARH